MLELEAKIVKQAEENMSLATELSTARFHAGMFTLSFLRIIKSRISPLEPKYY
jgi:hypothetical protein